MRSGTGDSSTILSAGRFSVAFCLGFGMACGGTSLANNVPVVPKANYQTVTQLDVHPLSFCYTRFIPDMAPHPADVVARGAGGHTFMALWKKRIIWQNTTNGLAWVVYARRWGTVVWCTSRALWAGRIESKRVMDNGIGAPRYCFYAFYSLTLGGPRKDLVAVPYNRFFPPLVGSRPIYGITVLDIRSMRTAVGTVRGFPYEMNFGANALKVQTVGINPDPRKNKYFSYHFGISARKDRLLMQGRPPRITKRHLPSAGSLPILVNVNQRNVKVGNSRVNFGKSTMKIAWAIGGRKTPGIILILLEDNEFGLAKAPHWRFHPLGRLRHAAVIGYGNDGDGFWVAQAGAWITLINRDGTIRVISARMPLIPKKQ